MSTLLKLAGVTLPGAGYEKIFNFVDLELPVTAGLVGLYQFGGSLERSLANLANPAQPLLAIGTPVVGPVGCLLADNTSGFDTGLDETEDFTYIAAAKVIEYAGDGSIGAMMIGNYGTATADGGVTGSSMDQRPGSPTARTAAFTIPLNTTPTNLSASTALTGNVAGDWNLFALRCEAALASGCNLDWVHSGVLTSSVSATAATRALSTRKLRIGGHPAGSGVATFSRPLEILAAAIFDRRITNEERLEVYSAIRAFYAQGGIDTI